MTFYKDEYQAKSLVELAQKFNLSSAEELFLKAVENGKSVDFLADNNIVNISLDTCRDQKDVILRSFLISWLCIDPIAKQYITHKGICVQGALIEGKLELEDIYLENPITFKKCIFLQKINLKRSKIKHLDLSGSSIFCSVIDSGGKLESIAVEANGFYVDDDVCLSENFIAHGTISLCRVTIGGNLNCENGKFLASNEPAINMSSANVRGSVLLKNFRANTQIWLNLTTINGHLDCSDGVLINPWKHPDPRSNAIIADHAEIKGPVLLNRSTVSGRISLMNATFGGLECIGGKFIYPDGEALFLGDAKIKGSVRLSNGFMAIGKVSLVGATISGELTCKGAILFNLGKEALNAQDTTIRSSIYLYENFVSLGTVNFKRAKIYGNLVSRHARFFNIEKDTLVVEFADIKAVLWTSQFTHALTSCEYRDRFAPVATNYAAIELTDF